MNMNMNKKSRTPAPGLRAVMMAAALGAAALLAGCGISSVSKGVTDEGTAADVVFPELSRASAKDGIFPNVNNLRQVGAGVTKAQLYDLLGAPHFAEGIGEVREWDYIFRFRDVPSTGVTTCRYKVLFDKDMQARTFHWKPASCVVFLNAPLMAAPPAMALAPQPEPSSSSSRSVKTSSIGADGVFRFGKQPNRRVAIEVTRDS
jgi:OOP family OmpA-OmpF porin